MENRKAKVKTGWIKAYKGFDKNMQCRGFQFKEGEEYSLPDGEEAELCKKGFHACEAPMDCWNYYNPVVSQYHEVELDATDEKSNDTKRVGKKIHIKAKLNIAKIVEAQVEYVKEHSIGEAATTGNWANAATTGEGANAATTGNWANAATTGNWANAATTGNWANAATTGEGANAEANGKNAVAAALGANSKCRAALGNWIVCTEYNDEHILICVKAIQVDGKTVKANTWYKLENGEFVEVSE